MENTMTQTKMQIGPRETYSCKGCTELSTFKGEHQAHHSCEQGVWSSMSHTGINEYPKTPKHCPFLTN